jgi:hypothetical protein
VRTRLAFAAALQLLVLSGLAMGQTASAPQKAPLLTFVGRIPLTIDGRIDHTSIDLTGQRLFSSGNGSNVLDIIDLKTAKEVGQIKSLSKPQNSFYVASVNRLFVSSGGDGTVKIFDGTTYKLQRTVQLTEDADNIRYDARRHHVLVDYGGEKFMHGQAVGRNGMKDGAVAVLDEDGNKVADIPTGGHPESLQLEQKGNRIFINSPDNHYVVVADLDTNKVLAHWDNFDRAREAKEITHGDRLVEQLRELTSEAERLKERAEQKGDYRTALAAVRELCRIIELVARLSGELNERPETKILNVTFDPQTAKRIAETFLARQVGSETA